MKFSGLTKWGTIAIGVGFLVWCVLMFMAGGGETKSKGALEDSNRCPDCGLPLSPAAKATGVCYNCEIQMGPEAARAARERRRGGGMKSLTTSPVIPITLVVVEVILVAAHLGVVLRRRSAAKGKDGPEYFYLCPKCGRKLRYRQRQIGRAGKCPVCRRLFLFPKPLTAVEKPSLFQNAALALRSLVSRKGR